MKFSEMMLAHQVKVQRLERELAATRAKCDRLAAERIVDDVIECEDQEALRALGFSDEEIKWWEK